MSNKSNIPLIPINPNTLKIKESQNKVWNIQQPQEQVIGPQLPNEYKSLRKKSLPPPVPKFEDSKPNFQISSKDIEKQETLNKFLMEIKGEDYEISQETEIQPPTNDLALNFEKKEANPNEKSLQKMEIENSPCLKEVNIVNVHKETPPTIPIAKNSSNDHIEKEPAVFQKPDFKLNLDMISNMYKQNISQNSAISKKDTPKKSEGLVSSNEKVLIPLMKKEIKPLTEEYDPSKPNDYETLLAERNEKNRKLKEQERKLSLNSMDLEPPITDPIYQTKKPITHQSPHSFFRFKNSSIKYLFNRRTNTYWKGERVFK